MSSHNSQLQSSQQTATPLVSVIVPCYNAARFLRKCLKSILRQTFTDIEVIAVNDGSTDDTLAVLQEFERKDSRIRIIDQGNQGPSQARMTGVRVATADYIVFVDSDDFIAGDYVATLYHVITTNQVDIVACNGNYNIRRWPWRHTKAVKPISITGRPIRGNDLKDFLINFFGHHFSIVVVWAHIYRKSLFENATNQISFLVEEDAMFNAQLYHAATSVLVIDYQGYYYRPGGFTSDHTRYLKDIHALFAFKKALIDEWGLDENYTKTNAKHFVNLLHIHVQHSLMREWSTKSLCQSLEQELKEPIYDDIATWLSTDIEPERLVLARDVDGIIAYNRRLTPPRYKVLLHRWLKA